MNIKQIYINEIENEFIEIEKNEEIARRRTTYTGEIYNFTLQDIYETNNKKHQAKLQNIISSIPLIHSDKIIMFKTITLNPSCYLKLDYYDYNFKQKLLTQDNIIKNYQREFRRLKNKRYVYIYEITDNLNFHLHQCNYLNTIEDIKQYIKYSFIAKAKHPLIGRTELKFDYVQKDMILGLFNDFKIKGYGELNIEEFIDYKNDEEFYIITQSKKKDGDFIKIAFIEDTKSDKKYLQRYLFKYLLKQKSKTNEGYEDSLEKKVCKVIKINQFMYSDYFFYDKISNKILFKLNDKIYSNRYIKIDIEDKNHTLYHIIELLKSDDIYKKENIYFYQNENNPILDLKSKYKKNEANTPFESLLLKYDYPSKQLTKTQSFEFFATYIFHMYDYSIESIKEEYEVESISELIEYLKLENQMFEEETTAKKNEEIDRTYETLDFLYEQYSNIEDNLMIEGDLETLVLIKNKIDELEINETYQFF